MNQHSQTPELISVIVPVYNIEKYLSRCLDAISAQTYNNLEIILVDDGSTDGSGRICDEFATRDSRARVIHHTQNQGLWAARNAGQDASYGAYLWFPDGDDYFHKDILRILYEAINQESGEQKYQLAICCSKKTTSSTEDTESYTRVTSVVYSRDELVYGLFRDKESNGIYHALPQLWNKLYRRDLIRPFRARSFVRAQDLDFNFRVFQQIEEAIVITNPLYYWVQRSDSLMKTKDASILYPACHSRILFSSYLELPLQSQKYRPLLLERLYLNMVFWRARTYQTNRQGDAFKQIRQFEHVTRKAYLHSRQIPLYKRLACLSLLHSPRLTRFLLKLTHNY